MIQRRRASATCVPTQSVGTRNVAPTWPLLVLVLVAAAVLIVIQWRRPRAIEPLVGLTLPPLEAAGWINTEAPLATDDLRGEVVLLDFWMTTCGPCVREMPELAQIHQRFRDQGLKVIGLTPESNDTGHVERVRPSTSPAWRGRSPTARATRSR